MQEAQSKRKANTMQFRGEPYLRAVAEAEHISQGADALHVVVLNWNLTADTLTCVDSLLADGFAPSNIVVVDNGSTIGRAELSQNLPAGVGQLYLPMNLGFAAGNNVGIAAALDRRARWVLLLNNDTIITQGARAALLDAAADGQFGLLSPLILYADAPQRIWSLGDKRVLGTLLTRSILRNQPPPAHLPALLTVDFLTACALMVRADVFLIVGLLDEGYFMYAEDADFCLRASRTGFHLGCATKARVAHKVSRSTGTTHPEARRWRTFHQARFYRLHAGVLQRVMLLMPFTLARALIMAAGDLAAARPQAAIATIHGWLCGWFDPPERGSTHKLKVRAHDCP